MECSSLNFAYKILSSLVAFKLSENYVTKPQFYVKVRHNQHEPDTIFNRQSHLMSFSYTIEINNKYHNFHALFYLSRFN